MCKSVAGLCTLAFCLAVAGCGEIRIEVKPQGKPVVIEKQPVVIEKPVVIERPVVIEKPVEIKNR